MSRQRWRRKRRLSESARHLTAMVARTTNCSEAARGWATTKANLAAATSPAAKVACALRGLACEPALFVGVFEVFHVCMGSDELKGEQSPPRPKRSVHSSRRNFFIHTCLYSHLKSPGEINSFGACLAPQGRYIVRYPELHQLRQTPKPPIAEMRGAL